jgi:hypothetical protein
MLLLTTCKDEWCETKTGTKDGDCRARFDGMKLLHNDGCIDKTGRCTTQRDWNLACNQAGFDCCLINW